MKQLKFLIPVLYLVFLTIYLHATSFKLSNSDYDVEAYQRLKPFIENQLGVKLLDREGFYVRAGTTPAIEPEKVVKIPGVGETVTLNWSFKELKEGLIAVKGVDGRIYPIDDGNYLRLVIPSPTYLTQVLAQGDVRKVKFNVRKVDAGYVKGLPTIQAIQLN